MNARNILFVGNASAIDGKGLGGIIDSFPRVLRFNDFRAGGKYAADYGTRCTHHSFSWEMRAHAREGCELLVSTAAHHYASRPEMQAHTMATRGGDAEVVGKSFVTYASRVAKIEPPKFGSTGLVTVRWMIESNCHPVLLNFDGFATGHYYPGDTGNARDQAAHQWDAETEHFRQLEKQGYITILRP